VVEEVAGRWVLDLLGLPAHSSVGFVTGGCVATFTCLASARHHVLAEHGWDVERDGLQGAPRVRVLMSDQRHATVDLALRYLGLGAGQVELVATDDQGRMDVEGLREALEPAAGPTIVCLAAGNVNTGAFDDFTNAIDLAHRSGA